MQTLIKNGKEYEIGRYQNSPLTLDYIHKKPIYFNKFGYKK